jgi:lysophospholipase L1-like esterase
MTTITTGNRNTIVLNEGQELLVVGDAFASAVAYKLLDSSGTASSRSYAIAASTSQTIGPFSDTTNIMFVCSAGTVTVTKKQSSATAVKVSTDASGNVLGLLNPVTGSAISLGTSGGSGISGFTVTNPSGLARWRLALADADTVVPHITVAGHSIAFGQWSNNTGTETEAIANTTAFAGRLRTYLARLFSSNESGFLNPDMITSSTGFTQTTSLAGCAGFARYLGANATPGTNKVRWTTPVACTSIELYYFETNGSQGGSATTGFKYIVDGAGDYATDSAGSTAVAYAASVESYKKVTITGLSNAVHTLDVYQTASSGNAIMVGIRYYSAVGVSVGKFGRPGWTSGDILGNSGASGQNNATALQQARILAGYNVASPALVILMIVRNDWVLQGTQSSTPTVTATNLTSIINTVVAGGACVLIVADPDDPVNVSAPTQYGANLLADYKNAAKALATTNSHMCYVDVGDIWGTYTQANAAGLQANSSVHPSRKGHADIGRAIYKLIGHDVLAVTG